MHNALTVLSMLLYSRPLPGYWLQSFWFPHCKMLTCYWAIIYNWVVAIGLLTTFRPCDLLGDFGWCMHKTVSACEINFFSHVCQFSSWNISPAGIDHVQLPHKTSTTARSSALSMPFPQSLDRRSIWLQAIFSVYPDHIYEMYVPLTLK